MGESAVAPGIEPATARPFGLYPGGAFRVTTGACTDCASLRQALWFFENDIIAVPKPGERVAGFAPGIEAYEDLRRWVADAPADLLGERPPLIWVGSPQLIDGARLDGSGSALVVDGARLDFAAVPKLELNRSYWNEASARYLADRPLRARGEWVDARFVARTVWPADWKMPARGGGVALHAIEASPAALRALVRALPDGGARSPFAAIKLRDNAEGSDGALAGKPVVAVILNGAQGDDDEAHAGHFALVSGRVGAEGEIADWLVGNFYSLDHFSEKGIVAALTPLDNYQADLNSGQSWYRPSYMVVAVLTDEQPAAYVQAALARMFNQFYRKQLVYEHSTMNCTSISVDVVRGLGWEVPARGPMSWAMALAALPLVAINERSIEKGRVAFDYFTEDQTRLFPAAAFEEIGAELLRLAAPAARSVRSPVPAADGAAPQGGGETSAGDGAAHPADSPAEALLRRTIESVWFLRIPQIPSSRAFGTWPIVNSREYHARVPTDPAQRTVVPVPPRPFPDSLRDPDLRPPRRTRGQHAVRAYAVSVAVAVVAALWWALGR